MSDILIFYPVFCQVTLTVFLLYATGRTRLAAIRRGEVKVEDVALGQSAWPPRPTQFSNAYNSQFQLPVLFYIVVLFVVIKGQVDAVMVGLAWGFVAMRLGHAWVFATSNNVRQRFKTFVAGLAVLIAMWITFAFNLIMSGG